MFVVSHLLIIRLLTEMHAKLLRLYPTPPADITLEGAYLSQSVRVSQPAKHLFVYTNFIASLDGRISLPNPVTALREVPAAIANPHDWRLYMELLAQADALVTTTRHLRAVAAGRHGNLLRLAEAEFPDIVAWRRALGLPPHPVCIAASASLDLPAEALCACHDGPIEIVTTHNASTERVGALERAGVTVLRAGHDDRVDGSALIDAIAARGYRFIYSIAGPRLFHTLLSADVIDRLYLTLSLSVLGGERYDTLITGPLFEPVRRFALRGLYLDDAAGQRQLFAQLDRDRG